MGKIIGIDLGTTYSCVGIFQNGKVEIIANENGNRLTPSYVAFTDTELLLGDAAKNQAAMNPENTVFAVKRLIGRKFDDDTVQEDMKYWPFKVICVDGKPMIEVKYKHEIKSFTPAEISSMILKKMKQIAEVYLGEKVSSAVVTVPIYFNDSQRQATKAAALMAGLNVIRIVNEPEAAAIAYGLNKQDVGYQYLLVFDLGGGTLNISILTQLNGYFEVRSTSGDTHLGGEDFDYRMIEYFINRFKRIYSKDLQSDKRALRRLRTSCEAAKLNLSISTEAAIEIDSLHDGIDFYSTITRTCFEELNTDLFNLIMEIVQKTLNYAKIDKSQIEEIILVGGSTRIPKLQNLLQDFFNGKQLNRSINPDQAVAYGAATQAAILTGNQCKEIEHILLVNVAPFSLGIETDNGEMTVLIKRNTNLPTKNSTTLSVTRFPKNQSEIIIKIFEGEHSMTKDNWFLGSFTLSIVSLASADTHEIDVTFDTYANSTLEVIAVDKNTKNENRIIIIDKEILSKAEAEICKTDQLQRDRIQAKKSLAAFCLNMKARLNDEDLGNKIDTDTRNKVLHDVEDKLKWLEVNQHADKKYFQCSLKKLAEICTPIMIKIYSTKNSVDRTNTSYFYNACRDNNINLVKYYLEIMSIEDINRVESDGSTALHVSAYLGHEEIVELLLRKGACCSIKNKYNRIPFDEAKTDKIKEMLRRRMNSTRFISDTIEWIISTNDADFQAHQYLKQLETYGKDPNFYRLIDYIQKNYIEKYLQDVWNINTVKRYFNRAIDEKDPVYLLIAYTAETGFYSALNVQLAKLQLEKLNAKENLSVAYYIGIIARHPQFETRSYIGSTYRGMMITNDDIKNYKIGTRILTKTFSSTSKQLDVALHFLSDATDATSRLSTICIYEIRNQRTALDIAEISLFSVEEEVLILPCSAFKIIDIEINKGGLPEVQIKLKECEPW